MSINIGPLFITILLFFLFVFFQIVLHRLLMKYGIFTFKTTLIFIAGFIINIIAVSFIGHSNTAMSLIILYALLSIIFIMTVTSPFYGESPSAKIISLIIKNGQLSKKTIISNFSNKILIDERLRDLQDSDLIKNRKNKYYITSKGKALMNLIKGYRKIIGWNLVG